MRIPALLLGLTAVALNAQDGRWVGKKAEEINAQGWINTDPLSLAKLKGKVVVIEFWATW